MIDILTEADAIIKERAEQYGEPQESLTAIGDVWSALLRNKLAPGERVTASDVALLMAGLKLVRESNLHKHDSILDAIAYITLASKLKEQS
jgi:flagella basal body P-ring formation protein FlgA